MQSSEDSVSVGEIVSEIALTNRPNNAEDDDAESGTEDERDEEEN